MEQSWRIFVHVMCNALRQISTVEVHTDHREELDNYIEVQEYPSSQGIGNFPHNHTHSCERSDAGWGGVVYGMDFKVM